MDKIQLFDNLLRSELKEREEYLSKILFFLKGKFFNEYLQNTEQIKRDYIEQWKTSFNIFNIISDITDQYYRLEKLHSYIIASIFNPKTPEIFDKEYLKIFMGLLKIVFKEKQKREEDIKAIKHDFKNKYNVIKENPTVNKETGEKGYIDILITNKDEKKAIIIENKLNNASDTNNQLAKYFDYVKNEKGSKVLAVAYITLDPNKKPDMNYDAIYESIIPEINNVLVPIPAISDDGYYKKNDFVHGFLEKCLRNLRKKKKCLFRPKKKQKAEFFFEQYTNLLKYLGGEYMLQNERKKLAEKLFEREFLPITNEIKHVIDKRRCYMALLFSDYFSNELKENHSYKQHGDSIMRTEVTESVYLIFYHDIEGFGFGFTNNEYITEIPKEEKSIIKRILSEEEFKGHYTNINHEIQNYIINLVDFEKWLEHTTKLEKCSINDAKEFLTQPLLKRLEELKAKAKKELSGI